MDNQLHGSIPSDIGFTLPNLSYFSVAVNNFTGTIPSSFSNMSKLEKFQLGTNNFVGSVPIKLGNLKSLKVLRLRENNLGSGQANDLNFLDSLVNCTNLKVIKVSYNNFWGVLPSFIANVTSDLVELNFRRNQLYGSIPSGT
ncbi:hypothetical protein MKX03_017236 [Papaver bracteatum]|nr:hypothetical protein MKX03_017236 [Papaver bracteatum]